MPVLESIQKDYRSGFVALIGRPNVGKSTFINTVVGEKVSITSPVAQTTRNRLRAIFTTPKAQLIFVDTPGIHKPHHLLGERLVQSTKSVIGEVDAVLLLLEGSFRPGKGDAFIVKLLIEHNIPVLVALNKWDLVSEENAESIENDYKNLIKDSNWPIHKCIAKNGKGCDEIIKYLINYLPFGPQLYPSEMISDQPEKVILGELIREQVLTNTREEIPHSVAVSIDRIDEIPSKVKNKIDNKKTAILATIFVERKSQKAILIGKKGAMLKTIGKGARLQMEKLIDGPIYLELFVKVSLDWRSNPARLSELGYKKNN